MVALCGPAGNGMYMTMAYMPMCSLLRATGFTGIIEWDTPTEVTITTGVDTGITDGTTIICPGDMDMVAMVMAGAMDLDMDIIGCTLGMCGMTLGSIPISIIIIQVGIMAIIMYLILNGVAEQLCKLAEKKMDYFR